MVESMNVIYRATVRWTGNRGDGTVSYDAYGREYDVMCDGKPRIEGSADPSYLGDASRHNPEDLLVAALSACHMLWYLHLCAVRGVVVTEYVDGAEGVMNTNADGSGEFVKVVLRPRVTVTTESGAATAATLHDEAHKLCFIARSVNFPVEHVSETVVV